MPFYKTHFDGVKSILTKNGAEPLRNSFKRIMRRIFSIQTEHWRIYGIPREAPRADACFFARLGCVAGRAASWAGLRHGLADIPSGVRHGLGCVVSRLVRSVGKRLSPNWAASRLGCVTAGSGCWQ